MTTSRATAAAVILAAASSSSSSSSSSYCYCGAFSPARSAAANSSPAWAQARAATALLAQAQPSSRSSRRPRPAAPRRYVQIEAKGDSDSLNSRSRRKRRFEVQTAVTTFTRPTDGATVDLHAQLHFGTARYYSYYNDDPTFAGKYDRTHYELVVSEDFVDVDGSSGQRRLRPSEISSSQQQSPIMASTVDANTARSYGLQCQVDVINYAQNDWVHADLTREEFVQAIEERDAAAMAMAAATTTDAQTESQQQPLWALASTAAVFPGSELFNAILYPSPPAAGTSFATSSLTRRLFSNLFLPGDALAGFIRLVLWLSVPAPELSVLLLDWSSLSPRPTGGISPIALPVLECLLSGNVQEARRLVFGQMIVSGQAADAAAATSTNNGNNGDSVLIAKRNERAIDVLEASVERDGCRQNALLYGASHCLDLQRRLETKGFQPTKTEWRTAWSVDVPAFGLGSANDRGQVSGGTRSRKKLLPAFVSDLTSSSSSNGIAVALVVLPLYLLVGGFDWIATIGEVGGALGKAEGGDAMLETMLYLVRHVALYLGLAKFVVEWDGQANLFGGDSD